jgi:hypothetical protein
MTPPRRKSAAASAPLIQDRPAEPVRDRSDAQGGQGGGFPPNPVPGVRKGPPRPVTRYLKVTGPHEVHGVKAPGWLQVDLTDGEVSALVAGGHVMDYPAGAGWGEDPKTEDSPVEQTQDQGDKPAEEGN